MADMDERLKRLIARREAAHNEREGLLAQRKAIVDLADEEAREDLSPEEDGEFRKFTAEIKEKDSEIAAFDERIAELSEEIERDAKLSEGAAAVRRAQARAQVLTEARTYEKGNGRSYLQDVMRKQLNLDADGTAGERLARHAMEVRTDKEYRDLDRTDGTGGYFVPPAWLLDQFASLARAGRAVANVVTSQPLPGGTDSINIPKVLTGTETGVQTADNTAITETDLTDTSVNAPVRTIAGHQDVSLQLLDQSPVNFDQVVFSDLVADYATKVDQQVIGGSGTSGQVLGIRSTVGIETVTVADADPRLLYAKLADAVQRVHTQRFQPPTVIAMHPRRWAALQAATDTNGRPILPQSSANPSNAIGTLGEVASEGVVGSLHGLPVVTDPNIPTTVSTTQDVVLVLRASDLLLFESGIRTRVLPEVGAKNLTVGLQVYGYIAFTAGRYPKSIVEVGGAGLVAPTFTVPSAP
ncbi:phage major capsid protein [Gordonia iterans]